MDLGEQLALSTVRITCWDLEKNEFLGTGFIYTDPFEDVEDHSLDIIVTNRHVIEQSVEGRIRFHVSDQEKKHPFPSRESKQVFFKDWSDRWFCHPDPNIDLACMPIGDVTVKLSQAGHKRFSVIFGPQHIPPEDGGIVLSAVEDIYMVGYPIGLWDELHNMPLVRRGITATSPNIDFNGKPEFLIDIACFPGSSGSPVVKPKVSESGGLIGGYLLGVLYAGPIYTAEGSIKVRKAPTRISISTETAVMTNLGYVVKSREITNLVSALKDAARDPNDKRFNLDLSNL